MGHRRAVGSLESHGGIFPPASGQSCRSDAGQTAGWGQASDGALPGTGSVAMAARLLCFSSKAGSHVKTPPITCSLVQRSHVRKPRWPEEETGGQVTAPFLRCSPCAGCGALSCGFPVPPRRGGRRRRAEPLPRSYLLGCAGSVMVSRGLAHPTGLRAGRCAGLAV